MNIIVNTATKNKKSKFIDLVLDRTLDRTIMALMMDVIATNGTSFATNDVIEKMMDKQIIDIMMNEINALGHYKNNIAMDQAKPKSVVPPSAEKHVR